MKNITKLLLISLLTVFLIVGNAMATQITINDNREGGSNAWHTNTSEDQEVEPGMVPSQVWDLEGFFLDGSSLSMVGGFDFVNGVPSYNFPSGDIFIDATGDAQFGLGQDTSVLNLGYDYVIDVDWERAKDLGVYEYNVYTLDSDSILSTTYYNSPESDPYRLQNPDGDNYVTSGTFAFESGLTDAETGFAGGTHYRVSGFDLSFLADPEFIVHFTMKCGNDNLMGANPVPEPATMLLLGTGLIGMAGIGRKKYQTK